MRAWVKSVTVNSLHGYRGGVLQLTGLGDGLNVVCGPNGAGKSTLSKAISLALNPKGDERRGGKEPFGVSASLMLGEEHIAVAASRGDEPHPSLAFHSGRYQLDIRGLLEGLAGDESGILTQAVLRGLELNTAKPSSPRKAAKEAIKALKRWQEAAGNASAVREEEERLPGLRRESAEAREAAARAQRIGRWLEALASLRQAEMHRDRAAKIESDWPGIELQKPGADETARTLDKQARESAAEADRLALELRRFSPQGGAPKTAVTDFVRANLRAQAAEAREMAKEAGRRALDLAAAERRAEKAKADIDSLLPGVDTTTLIDAAAQLLAAAGEEDARRRQEAEASGLAAASRLWVKEPPPPPKEALEQCLAWLSQHPGGEGMWLLGGAGAVAAGAAVGVVISPSAGPIISSAGACIVLALLGGSAWLLAWKPAAARKEAAGKSGGAIPEDARPSDVAGLLQKAALANAKAEASAALSREAARAQERAVGESGGQAPGKPILMSAAAGALKDWQTASLDAEAERGAIAQAQARLAEARSALREGLAAAGVEPGERPEEEVEALEAWASAARAWEEAVRRSHEFSQALAGHLAANGVAEGGAGLLAARAQWVRERDRCLADAANAERSAIQARAGLAEEPWMELESEEALTALKAEAEAEGARASELDQAIGSAEATIRAAEKAINLDVKADEFAAAYREVEAAYEASLAGEAAVLAADWLKDRLSRHTLPPLLLAASRRMEQFTGGRYAFEADSQGNNQLGGAVVVDRERGLKQGFGQLSNGAKVHAVLAVRLGAIDQEEGDRVRHPILLDEVLAVSDPESSRALAGALAVLAKERQVIVFTNQPEDVSLLAQADPDAVVHPLGGGLGAPVEPTALPASPRGRGPGRFRLDKAVGSHHPSALWPGMESPSFVYEAAREDPQRAAFAEGLEASRQALVREFPLLTPEAIQECPLAASVFLPLLLDQVEEAEGVGLLMKAALPGIKGLRKKDEFAQWLEENGFLWEPPQLATISRIVREQFPPETPPEVITAAAFILAGAFPPAAEVKAG